MREGERGKEEEDGTMTEICSSQHFPPLAWEWQRGEGPWSLNSTLTGPYNVGDGGLQSLPCFMFLISILLPTGSYLKWWKVNGCGNYENRQFDTGYITSVLYHLSHSKCPASGWVFALEAVPEERKLAYCLWNRDQSGAKQNAIKHKSEYHSGRSWSWEERDWWLPWKWSGIQMGPGMA